MLTKDLLEHLYWDEKLSTRNIAKLYNLNQKTVLYWFKKFGIPRRTWIEGRKLRGYGKEHLRIPNLNPSEDLSYILGVCLGDGSVTKCGKKCVVELAATDYNFVQSFGASLRRIGLNPCFGVIPPKEKNRTKYYIHAQSKVFYDWFKALTINDIENMVKDYIPQFVRGFYESEGSFAKRKHGLSRLRIVNAKKDLIDLVARLIEKLGFKVSIRYHRDKRPNRKGTYCIEILGGELERRRFIEIIKPVNKNLNVEPQGHIKTSMEGRISTKSIMVSRLKNMV